MGCLEGNTSRANKQTNESSEASNKQTRLMQTKNKYKEPKNILKYREIENYEIFSIKIYVQICVAMTNAI